MRRFLIPRIYRHSKAQARAEARGFVAALGEHNEQVLRECLGWSRDSIGKLAKEGVLCGKRAEPEDEP